VNVTDVGGHIDSSVPGTLFAAIIKLTSPTALPVGFPFTGTELMASTTFTPPDPSADILTQMSVTLVAGDYALIFGDGGTFGTTSSGAMPANNTDLPGASYFFWTGSVWLDGGFSNTRFVVVGTAAVVPEPGTLAMFGLGLAGLGLARRRRAA
jgi:hypothetical protein